MRIQCFLPGSFSAEELDVASPVRIILDADVQVTVTSEGILVDLTDEKGHRVVKSWYRKYHQLFEGEEDSGGEEEEPEG